MRLFREGLVQLAGRLMIMLRGRSAGFSATKPVLAGRVTSFERGIAWWAKRQTDKSASCAESGSDPKSLTPREFRVRSMAPNRLSRFTASPTQTYLRER